MDTSERLRRPRPAAASLVSACVFGLSLLGGFPAQAQSTPESFERKIRPLLAEHCVSCHGPEKQKGHLRLDAPEFIRAGGESGPILIPGNPNESRLIQAVRYAEETFKMPPKQKLPAPLIETLTRWVQDGAAMPETPAASTPPVRKEFSIGPADRAHWAFQPVRPPRVAARPPSKGGPHPIDVMIDAGLRKARLAANGRAHSRELVRRAFFDLAGLPPSPEDVAQFESDPSEAAWARLIDRLLDSPHYGEKWGRHWLDLVRFAESNSYERDGPKPHAWRYRDYVIRSFNADKPFDRFILEQLAGDELPSPDAESIIATGYYRLGIWDDEPADRELARYDGLDDILATTGQVFLGLTIDCARCHHHKIDPISQHDYYRLLSFFQNINPYRNGGETDEVPVFGNDMERRDFASRKQAHELRAASLRKEIDDFKILMQDRHAGSDPARRSAFNDEIIAKEGARLLGDENWKRFSNAKEQLEKLKRETIPAARALAVTEAGSKPGETFVLLRGNPALKGDRVDPGFLDVLGASTLPPEMVAPSDRSSGRRTAIARWIAAPENPLTARVLANRLWQYHFGRGLVRSSSNFGLQGDKPTHPELLDWLAAELVQGGWSLKRMHRLIMSSEAYRRSSRGREDALQSDPMNHHFWRFDPRRLAAEEIRDAILSIAGNLNPRMHGPGVYVDIPKEVLAGQSQPGSGWGKSSLTEQSRRSVYIHVKRSLLTPVLDSFDMAETDRSTPIRFATVQPTQALGMLNGDFLNHQSAVFAERIRKERGNHPRGQVERALALATSRIPSPPETDRGVNLMEAWRQKDGLSAAEALRQFCLLALNLNEVIYLD